MLAGGPGAVRTDASGGEAGLPPHPLYISLVHGNVRTMMLQTLIIAIVIDAETLFCNQ